MFLDTRIKKKPPYVRTKEDREYERSRNKLIPVAEKIAFSANGKKPRGAGEDIMERWANSWNLSFHRAMNNLAKESGLCS